MDVGVYPYPHGDSLLIDKIVNEFLSQGRFDKLRKECMSDADTKPAYQNLQQRVENTVTQFLKKQVWRPDLNKNQLRDSLRKHVLESKFFDAGINRIVDQVVNPNVLATVFMPEVEEVVYNYLSIPKPSDKSQRRVLSDERVKSCGREYEYQVSQEIERFEKYGREKPSWGGDQRKENHIGDEDFKPKDFFEGKFLKISEIPDGPAKVETTDDKERTEEKVKLEIEEETHSQILTPEEKMEISSEESQESLNRMTVEGLHINELDEPSVPDSDDSIPLEINEKSMSESQDSEDSIMNQMSPISQGRLTPDLEEDFLEGKLEEKTEEKEDDKKPLTFVGRICKIKREDSDSSKSSKTKENIPKKEKEKLEVKNVYSSDDSDSSKSYGKSDSDERRKNEKLNKEERKRGNLEERSTEKKRENSKEGKRERSRDRHKDHKRERSRERYKKSSSSSSSSQRERSSSHHKSSHRHKYSRSRRKEEEKKKNKSTDDHGKERNKKEDRRSTDRDSNERERGRSSGSRTEGESRKREKEQSKAEETTESSSQKEKTEVEQEGEVLPEVGEVQPEVIPQEEIILAETETTGLLPNDESDNSVLDFKDLFQCGALSKLEFPKLTDDFYVKFNSTGFRYFEEWEKTKLDCEEEFKEFVDEAENNLSLLSDDESESEFESRFAEENRMTIRNLLKGLGNFRRSFMFDPGTSEFYKWTNNKFYQKFRKKEETRERRNTEKNESDESIKENIDRGEKNRALHLKLLNKYKRKAMRMGKPRRRHRRPECGGIKEKNENRSVPKKEFFNGANETESFRASRVPKLPDSNLVESESPAVPDNVNSLNNLFGNEVVTLPDSPEEIEEWSDAQKTNEEGKTNTSDRKDPKLSQNLPLHLPPSPDSDDINTNSDINAKSLTIPRKRINKDSEEGGSKKKQTRRNYSQKYESQDLYKPRPVLNRSRTRKRESGLERNVVSLGSPVSR